MDNKPADKNHRVASRPRKGLRPLLLMRAKPGGPLSGETEQYKGTPGHLLISAVVMAAVLSLIMVAPMLPSQDEIEPGMPAARNVLSPTYLSYTSKVLTDKAREEAMSDPKNEVWARDTRVIEEQKLKLLNALFTLEEVRQNGELDAEAKRHQLSSLTDIELTSPQIEMLLVSSDANYRNWRDNGVIPAFDDVMKNRRLTSAAEVQAIRNALPELLSPSLTPEQRAAAAAFIAPLLTVNMGLDVEQTRQRSEQAASSITPIAQTVQKGEAILRQGDLATPEAIEKMREAGLLGKSLSAQNVIGTIGIVSLLVILLHLYILRHAQQVWRRQKQLLLVDLLILFTVATARLFLPGHTVLPYMLPVAAVSMLVAVLVNSNLAVVLTFILSLLLGMVVSSVSSLEMPIYYLAGGLAGIFTLTKVEKVSTFARAGFYVSVASFLAAFMLKVLTVGAFDWGDAGIMAMSALFNAGISTAITYAAFSMLGTLFSITTPLQLMELAHPNQPLLRRLMREAPGTYHHSLMVSNLAEHAAEMVGADQLLTRVCAYYHDIGKAEHPYYFIDNQAGRSNVHDELDPKESAAIIARHVSDGVSLGEKHKLPRRVLDAIPQHHGTMLIKYFYYKALEHDPKANPDDYRYPGPKPQTKENAILMLADGVEATVRAMAQSGALDKIATADTGAANADASESTMPYNDTASLPDDAIANIVRKIIAERIEEGQLDECDLTVRDIARIQEAFVSMLKGIYHPRITYPEGPKAKQSERDHAAAKPGPIEPVITATSNGYGVSPANGSREPEAGTKIETGGSEYEQHTPTAGT